MDYTKESLNFKLRKAARYTRLYGPRRTAAKVRAQYHLSKVYDVPPPNRHAAGERHVGIIGCGNFAFSCIAYYLRKNYGDVIRGVMDIDVNRSASLSEAYGAGYYTTDSNKLINDPGVDLLYIASNHASHAEYAIQALERGKHVHIEKPHVVTADQLTRLCAAMKLSGGRVALGFNRPLSRIGRKIKAHLAAQDGPAMVSWFIAGHAIDPDHWYFREEEGGRVLGNLCHWTDFTLQLVPAEHRYPITVHPIKYEKSDCDVAVTYTFGDGTIAAISFSAKGHTFEGVKERFSAHRGDLLIASDDFKSLSVQVGSTKKVTKQLFRDHGHEESICRSYQLARPSRGNGSGCDVPYVWDTGELFLSTKDALDQERSVSLLPYVHHLPYSGMDIQERSRR